jgi:ABC-type glycerol-3-phosphate transport system substrate-binding protein
MELSNITFLPDDRVFLTTTGFDRAELVTLNKIPQDEIPEITTITLALVQSNFIIEDAIAEFNRTNPFYHIVINEIYTGWDSPTDALARLALDVMTGSGPDIIDTSLFPFHQWAGQGLFVNLYELIDADPALSRDDFVEAVLSNLETDGRLYKMFPNFSIITLFANADVVGSESGWTLGEFVSVLEANPQAASPIGFTDGRELFQTLFMMNIDRFINWESGTVYFESEHFLEFLEYIYRLQEMIGWEDNINYIMGGSNLLAELASGEQIAGHGIIWEFLPHFALPHSVGEDFVAVGFPNEHRNGHLMWNGLNGGYAILSTSENQEGAWQFLRMILSEDWQRGNIDNAWLGFPTNSAVFNERMEHALTSREGTLHWGGQQMRGSDLPEDVSSFVDATLAIIESTQNLYVWFDPLLDIIFESLDDLFAGAITIEDTARIIQSRAAIFVAERS